VSDTLRDLYDRALDLPATERGRFLAGLEAAHDPRLARLRRLLEAADSPAGSPLDRDPWAGIDDEPLPSADDGSADRPARIGPYRILSELGRGGMGRVYLAEQEGADFRRNVALKVVAPEGAGVAAIERRFREERRILAGLEHPGIARLYDAGRAPDGSWYLALEYVAGSNLVEHARARDLGTAERVRLFLAVLEAVAFAHRASVVHRDLKPANIQVGADGRPRLLDFGIAKFIDGDSDGTAPAVSTTRTGMRALTPAYASPEQFRGDTITPASDVFSLGIVFYEHLTGVRPFEKDGTQAGMERAVLSEDPEPPSTAHRRMSGASGSAEPGGERPPRARRLARDLDAICLQALRKDPRGRYPTAAEFADDVGRYLAGQPVAARGGGLGYRLTRHYARHRPAVAVAAILLTAGAAVLYVEASRRRAVAAAGSAAAAGALDPAPRKFPFSGVSADDVAELERRFAAEPGSLETGAHLAIALEKGGRRPEAELIVTRLRQIPGRSADPLIDYVEATLATSAAEPQRALVLLTTALERAAASGRGDLVSQARAYRGRLLSTLGRGEEARADMTAARAGFEASGDTASLSRVLNDLAIEELQRGDLAAGERLLVQALEASRASGGSGGVMLTNLAGIALQRGRPDLAAARYREAVEIFRAAKSQRLSDGLTDLSEALRDLGKTREADEALAEAIRLRASSPPSFDLALALLFRGGAELDAGHLSEVERTGAEIQSVARATGERPALAFAGRLLGQVAGARGELAAARRELGDSSRLLRENGQEDWAAESDLALAEIEFRAGDLGRAAALAERVAPSEGTAGYLATALLAGVDARLGRLPEARARLETLGDGAADSPSVDRRLGYLLARARWARAAGREDQAETDYRTALAGAEAAGRHLLADQIREEAAATTKRPAQGTATGQ
jgi:tetratricopeptide (TPR) repeat protein